MNAANDPERLCNEIWYTTDTLPFQKKINHGEKSQYYGKNTHKAIIDRDVFQKTQQLLEQKGVNRKRPPNSPYFFTSRIVCDQCGTNFCRRITKNKEVLWACRKHFQNKELCSMESLPEKEIESAFLRMYSKLHKNCGEILGTFRYQLETLKEREFTGHPEAIEANNQLAKLMEQNRMLHQLWAKGCIDQNFFLAQSNSLNQQTGELRKRLKQYRDMNEYSKILAHTDTLLKILQTPMDTFQGDIFLKMAEKVIVSHETVAFRLINGLTFAESRLPEERM